MGAAIASLLRPPFRLGSGKIAGTGIAAGRYPFTIHVMDSTGARASVGWNVTILPLLRFAKGNTLPAGKVNRRYSAKIPVAGKDARLARFALGGRIPPGLELNDTTGRLTGTLLKAGTYRLRVFVFAANGLPISKRFVMSVRAADGRLASSGGTPS